MWGFGAGGHGSNGGKEEAPEYLTIENMYPLYANGTVSGTYKEDLVYSPHQHYWNSWTNFWGADTSRHDDYATYKETLYFGTDILGSVRAATDTYARLSGNISYDAFGSPYSRSGTFLNSESLDFGYLGKPYNATTELYDYGFRDYSPRNARFTTVDPIRDGRNWYAYVLNDPVNFVDWWGLCGENDIPEVDQYSLAQINAKANYLYYSESLSQLTKEALDISCGINQKNYQIEVLKGEVEELKVEYTKQTISDTITFFQVFGPAIQAASQMPPGPAMIGAFITNIAPEDLTEIVIDLQNSTKITKKDIKELEKKNNKIIKELKSEIKSMQFELKQNEKMQENAKNKTKESMEIFYENY